MEEKQNFFHGTLEVSVFDATPYTPIFPFNCIFRYAKPAYVTVKLDHKKVAKTSQEDDRVWNQTFNILCAHCPNTTITVTLKTKCSVLGKFEIKAQQLLNGVSLIEGLFPLEPIPEVKLRLMLWFKPADYEPGWSKVLSSNGQFQGLRNASFPQRSNCHVTLYQDTHHCANFGRQIPQLVSARHLWEDIYRAIEDARHLVYIAGWSLNPNIVLVRDPKTEIPHARGVQLGELLKQKAEEGVAVRVMLWNDETSLPFIKNKGVMNTHDEDSFAYFKNTKVICKLCPRLHKMFPTVFAHHQKTITVDSRVMNSSNEREILSFVGGLDLCDGRYDTEQHSLFHTLNKESHCYDFYQTNIERASLDRGGPRVPWHDCHASVTGEAARDILTNFEQRWSKQCDQTSLLDTSNLTRNNSIKNNTWNVQVFRSIDHISATRMDKNLTLESSIHEAYVKAIRKAERFIYIENQYFIGGCHFWQKDGNSGCINLIPVEIALKIVKKIEAKERFAVYVIIPMWPEGVPESEPVQDILHWTRETMAMMYRFIGEAVKESRCDPRDYLNFFCLANREMKRRGEFVPPMSPHPLTQYWQAQKNRRFMVYVHSKLMIVDDVYLMIGSANINQRSMSGHRDTEIAIGCCQPETDKIGSKMAIHDYRLSLWLEHTGQYDKLFDAPESLECVRGINAIGEKMWKIYSGDEIVDMDGAHLVSYPIKVTKEGVIQDLVDNCGYFPDTKTPVKGKRAKMLPTIFTT